MEQYINKNYRITTDTHNFILQKKRVAKKEDQEDGEAWDNVGYTSSIESILNFYMRKRQLSEEPKDFKELLDLTNEIRKEIKKLSEVIDV